MADDALSKLLLGAIEQHDRAVRWSWLLFAALAVFHLTTFERFVDVSREIARAERELARLGTLDEGARAAAADFESRIEPVRGETKTEIEEAFAALRGRFEVLNLSVAMTWCRAHAENDADYRACVEPAVRPVRARQIAPNAVITTEPAPTTQMNIGTTFPKDLRIEGTVQLQGTDRSGQPTVEFEDQSDQVSKENIARLDESLDQYRILPESLAEKVSQLDQRDMRLIDLLEPYIEETLIPPTFERINAFWRGTQVPKVRALAEKIAKPLMPLAAAGGTVATNAEAAIAAVQRVGSDAAALVLEPPEKPRWWLTLEGKGDAIEQIADHVDASVIERRAVGKRFDAVFASLSEAASAKEGLLSGLSDVMKNLEAQFKAQRAQLDEIVAPLKVVPIDLEFFCRHFALIVALAGVAMIVWPAEKLRVARLTAAIAREEGQDLLAWRWFERRQSGAGAAIFAGMSRYVFGAVLIVWALYTAFRLANVQEAVRPAWWEAWLGVLLLLSATVWCWQVLRTSESPPRGQEAATV